MKKCESLQAKQVLIPPSSFLHKLGFVFGSGWDLLVMERVFLKGDTVASPQSTNCLTVPGFFLA